MKRKIVRHGSSSLTVTLPSKWIEKYSINKGDEVNVEESGSNVIISTQKETASGKKTINSKDGKFTKNNLSHLYQLGYDEIEIELTDKNTLKEINERLPNCMGFEIIDQKNNRIYIKSIATTLDSEFDNMLKKSFLVAEEMGKEIINILENQNFKKLDEIRELERLNNKFTDICIRILNKKGYKIPGRTMQMYEIVKNIERVADELKYLCDALKAMKKSDKKTNSLIKESIEYFFMLNKIVYSNDHSLKDEIYSKRKALIGKLITEMKKNPKDSIVFHYLINIVQKTYEGFGGYLSLTL